VNKPCVLAIRPEAITISKQLTESADNQLAARVEQIEFGGATTAVSLDANGLKLEALVLGTDDFEIGEQCLVKLPSDQVRLLPEG